MKSTLKSNRNHTSKHPLNSVKIRLNRSNRCWDGTRELVLTTYGTFLFYDSSSEFDRLIYNRSEMTRIVFMHSSTQTIRYCKFVESTHANHSW